MAITITLKGRHLVGAGLLTVALAVGGCSQYNEARGKGDAPIGAHNDAPADVTNFPDGFGNVATKCSTIPGKRIWMATHGGAARTFTIENDESCH
jgi:hypothetical protein